MLNPLLQKILNERLSANVNFEGDKSLFIEISRTFDELSAAAIYQAAFKESGESIASSIDTSLKDIFQLLGSEKSLLENKVSQFAQLVPILSEIKQLAVKKNKNEQLLNGKLIHLKDIQALAKAGSWEVDLTENIDAKQHYWSDELFELLGVEPGSNELTYENYLALIHPDDQGLFELEVNKAISSIGMYDIEYRIIWKNENERFVRDTGRVLTDSNGSPSKMVGITFDITESKSTEMALSLASQEFQKLFNTMKEVFWSTDMVHNKLLQISPSCKQVYGYDPEEMNEDPNLWFKVILDQDKALFADHSELDNGQTICYEYRIRHKDGSIRWLEAKITPTLNLRGKLVRLDGINSDITARKQAESTLKNNELKFRSLIQNSNDVITIADKNLIFTFISESITTMTGFSDHEMLDTSVLGYIHPDHHYEVNAMLNSLRDSPDKPVYFKFRFLTKSAQWIWTEGNVTNLLYEKAIGGYVATFRDTTERTNYETSLELSNEELKKTNNELDRFVYSVSHDLRAPLASVLGLLEYSQSETDDEEMLVNLELMRESIEKLDIFILDILDYSRNARIGIKKQKINFHEIVAGVHSSLKFMSSGKTVVQIKLDIEECDSFYSDSGRIEVMLSNLISNSIRYYNRSISDPYVEVTINFDIQGAYLVVRDNGIGIDPKHHRRIFEMFYRVSNESTGSGLGLYLVKETIDKLSGTIDFRSEPGVGSEFMIYLPNLGEK